jgi:hypothetical protein
MAGARDEATNWQNPCPSVGGISSGLKGTSGDMPRLFMSTPAGVWYLATVMAKPDPSDSSTVVWMSPFPNVLSPAILARWLSCKAPANTCIDKAPSSAKLP